MPKRKADMFERYLVLVLPILAIIIVMLLKHGRDATPHALTPCTMPSQSVRSPQVATEVAGNVAVYGNEVFQPLEVTKEYDAAVTDANQLDKLMPPSFHGSNPMAITRGQVTRSVQLTALMRQPEGTRSATKRVTGTPNLITNVLCATKALSLTEQAIPFGDSDARQVAIMSTTRKYNLPVA